MKTSQASSPAPAPAVTWLGYKLHTFAAHETKQFRVDGALMIFIDTLSQTKDGGQLFAGVNMRLDNGPWVPAIQSKEIEIRGVQTIEFIDNSSSAATVGFYFGTASIHA